MVWRMHRSTKGALDKDRGDGDPAVRVCDLGSNPGAL